MENNQGKGITVKVKGSVAIFRIATVIATGEENILNLLRDKLQTVRTEYADVNHLIINIQQAKYDEQRCYDTTWVFLVFIKDLKDKNINFVFVIEQKVKEEKNPHELFLDNSLFKYYNVYYSEEEALEAIRESAIAVSK